MLHPGHEDRPGGGGVAEQSGRIVVGAAGFGDVADRPEARRPKAGADSRLIEHAQAPCGSVSYLRRRHGH